MVGSRNNQGLTLILFHELQERIQYPASFADVVVLRSLRPDCIYLIEQVNSAHFRHCIENESELRSCLTHELRDYSVQQDGEKRQSKLSGEYIGRHCLSATR